MARKKARPVNRQISDAWAVHGQAKLPQIDDIFQCLRSNSRRSPKSVTYCVNGDFIGADEEEIVTVSVVPTAIRSVYNSFDGVGISHEHKLPEYEFEGWLLGDYPQKIWTLVELRGGDPVREATLYRLEPGEETGIDPHSVRQEETRRIKKSLEGSAQVESNL